MFADECTSNIERISYARLLVEIDVTRELQKKIKVLDPTGRTFEQKVEYDWEPQYCPVCLVIGHKCGSDNPKPPLTKMKGPIAKQVWQSKGVKEGVLGTRSKMMLNLVWSLW